MSDDENEKPWDADDERRQEDCFAPPKVPCECTCLHCRRVFSSEGMWFQKVINREDDKGVDGFWMCPTNNCGGAGFTFDIFPTDPSHPANAGWKYSDDPPGEFDEDGEFVPPEESEWSEEKEEWEEDEEEDDADAWKQGLTPDQIEARNAEREAAWAKHEAEAAARHAEEQADFDRPDRRPRVIDDAEERAARQAKPFDDQHGEDMPF